MVGTSARALERYWKEQHREVQIRPSTAISVALMREAGTPGTTLAHEVGARLGWPVYAHELLERISNELGLRLSLLENMDERHKDWLTECLEAFSSGRTVTESTFVRHLIQTILSLGALGRCLFVGRGAAFILPGERTIRVRLVGDREDRIRWTAERRGMSQHEAARWIAETERERAVFTRDHFHKDIADPRHYDLVLNMSRWSFAECAGFIVDAIRRREERLSGL